MQSVTLNNGVEMPQLGYGVYLVAPKRANGACSMRLVRATAA